MKVLILISCLLTLQIQAQEKTIAWSEGELLEWSDFRGRPKGSSVNAALTSSGINSSFSFENGILTFEVDARFVKRQSWVRKKFANAAILNHEQRHFDISELFARKFVKRLIEESYKADARNIQRKYKAIFNRIMKEMERYQNQYDQETDHHRNAKQQALWDQKISREMDALKAYTQDKIRIDLN